MPAMKGKLGEPEVVQLVSLVRNFRDRRQVVRDEPEDEEDFSKRTEPEKPASLPTSRPHSGQSVVQATSAPVNPQSEAGRGLYLRFCVACHEADGHGSAVRAQMPAIPDFGSPVW